jgi:hypothetical protein
MRQAYSAGESFARGQHLDRGTKAKARKRKAAVKRCKRTYRKRVRRIRSKS